jgi:hypothetical protein
LAHRPHFALRLCQGTWPAKAPAKGKFRHLIEKQVVKNACQEIRHQKNELGLAEFNRGWPISAKPSASMIEKLALHGNLCKMLTRVEKMQSCRDLT